MTCREIIFFFFKIEETPEGLLLKIAVSPGVFRKAPTTWLCLTGEDERPG